MPRLPWSSPSLWDEEDPVAPDPLATDEVFWTSPKQAAPESHSYRLLEEHEAASGSELPSAPSSPSPTPPVPISTPASVSQEDTGEVLLLSSVSPTNFEVILPKSTLVNPRSQFLGWTPPNSLPVSTEYNALTHLTRVLESKTDVHRDNSEFVEFELNHFAVYVHAKFYPYELRPLQHLCTKTSSDTFYFNGVLSHGDVRHYVERVPFRYLPIGNYGTAQHSVGDQIWIRSRRNESEDPGIYYKLGKPAPEYERFHSGFLWIADLGKHVVDFCESIGTGAKRRPVTLRDFEHKFIAWLQTKHKTSPDFQRWRRQHPSDDFRTSVTANIVFIHKEVCGCLGVNFADSLQVFKEVKSFTQYKPFAPATGSQGTTVAPTIVTPYVHSCFSHAEFGSLLTPIASKEGCQDANRGNQYKTSASLSNDIEFLATPEAPWHRMIENIKAGDTISTPPDDAKVSKWREEVAKGSVKKDRRWFGLVQTVHVSKNGARFFDVIWLYRPVDTPCCKMVYPWGTELFLSDNCNCEGPREGKVDEDEVLGVHTVEWFGNPGSTAEFFVRQTYEAEHRRWVTLTHQHMKCKHNKTGKHGKTERLGYKVGDTVLVPNGRRLEPFEIVKIFKQDKHKFVQLRRLLRRCEVELNPHIKARPNELVYTDDMVVLKPDRISAKCIIRFFKHDEPIPTPYDREGTANIFFITHFLDKEKGTCVPMAAAPIGMRQGFDPLRRVPEKLRGLDLFCGSGNFGRGLEEGGVVDMRWCNDIWDKAVHTYMVNASTETKGLLGSVDDLLRCALEGNYKGGVPRPGNVDLISGGSPCQGFSLMNNDKQAEKQKKNRSLVASFASAVDFYRPKYGILENVLGIVQTTKGREDDAFSQLICAIVGLGYQTQIVLGDAWAYGAPQSRSRAFLIFAAPGFRLPDPPQPSHSHPGGVKGRGLGLMTSGEPFVERSLDPTPFKFVSAGEAAADLPAIFDAKADCCVAYPDHRVSIGITAQNRLQQKRIPTHPNGMNFCKAWDRGKGVMTPAEREVFPPTGFRVNSPLSKAWGRIDPAALFQTITTYCTIADGRTGRFMHWRENRPITILEARRAQGFLDHEVLAGLPTDQYHLIGNSVARQMALALGLQFRKAWLGSLYDDTVVPIQVEEAQPMASDCKIGNKQNGLEMEEVGWDDGTASNAVSEFGSQSTERLGLRSFTPSTSVPEPDTKPLGGSKKRLLSQAFADELTGLKKQRVEQQVCIDLTETESESVEKEVSIETHLDIHMNKDIVRAISESRSYATMVRLSPPTVVDLTGSLD